MIESAFSKVLKRRLKQLWPEKTPMWHRVENTAALGTFDSFIGSDIGSGWVELKQGGPNEKPAMRAGQPSFGIQCREALVPAHVLMVDQHRMIKVLNGWTIGEDWRDHLIMRTHLDDMEAMRMLLLRCMTGE